jgi:hypothetical protein
LTFCNLYEANTSTRKIVLFVSIPYMSYMYGMYVCMFNGFIHLERECLFFRVPCVLIAFIYHTTKT